MLSSEQARLTRLDMGLAYLAHVLESVPIVIVDDC